jgi:hypothetical protein
VTILQLLVTVKQRFAAAGLLYTGALRLHLILLEVALSLESAVAVVVGDSPNRMEQLQQTKQRRAAVAPVVANQSRSHQCRRD